MNKIKTKIKKRLTKPLIRRVSAFAGKELSKEETAGIVNAVISQPYDKLKGMEKGFKTSIIGLVTIVVTAILMAVIKKTGVELDETSAGMIATFIGSIIVGIMGFVDNWRKNHD